MIEGAGMADITPEIIELEEQQAVAVRGDLPVAELPEFFGAAFGAAAAAAEEAGVAIVGPPFGYYPEMPTDTVAVEAGFPVSAPVAPTAEAHPLVLPGGRAVVAVHVGPYDTLEATYGALMTWMAEQGLMPAGPMWESYVSDPEANPDPSTWQTQIVWPIA